MMKTTRLIVLAALASAAPASSHAQVAGTTLLDDKLVLAGATRDALKATPPFEYAN